MHILIHPRAGRQQAGSVVFTRFGLEVNVPTQPQLCLLEHAFRWTYEHKQESLSDFTQRRVFTGELVMTESQELLAQYAMLL